MSVPDYTYLLRTLRTLQHSVHIRAVRPITQLAALAFGCGNARSMPTDSGDGQQKRSRKNIDSENQCRGASCLPGRVKP